MKILLSSAGFQNPKVANKFLELVKKPTKDIKIIFVPTASRTDEEWKYVNISKQQLVEMGITANNITVLELDHKIDYNEVQDFDVIYVSGGNTYYLLSKVRNSLFDIIIKQFIQSNKLYFGVSAGSIIVGETIKTSNDENDVNLADLTGLKLIKTSIIPHYSEIKLEKVKNLKNDGIAVTTLTDNQALLILDNKMEIIGD